MTLDELIKAEIERAVKPLHDRINRLEDEIRKPKLYTVEETADMLRCAKSTIYSLVSAGKLRPVRQNRPFAFTMQAINEYLRNQYEK